MSSFLGPYVYPDPRTKAPPGFSNSYKYSRSYFAVTGHKPSGPGRFTPYTSSDDNSDGGLVVIRKKTKSNKQKPTSPLQKSVAVVDEPVKEIDKIAPSKSRPGTRLKRYFSRHFLELKNENNGPLPTSMSSTTLDNVEELHLVQSCTNAAATHEPHTQKSAAALRHSKSVGNVHLASQMKQGFPTQSLPSKTLCSQDTNNDYKIPDVPSYVDKEVPTTHTGEVAPSAPREITATESPSMSKQDTNLCMPQTTPLQGQDVSKSVPSKSPKTAMQRLEEKFASWFSRKISLKTNRKDTLTSEKKKKFFPARSSSSSVSSTLLLDSSSSNDNPKKTKKKRVDFVLVHKQVESLFHDKRQTPPKLGNRALTRLRDNMSTSEVTPAPDSGPDKNTLKPHPHISPTNDTHLHKNTTSITSDPATLFIESDMASEDDQATWNDGYRLWKERRAAWLQPHPEYLQEQQALREGQGNGNKEDAENDAVRFEDIPEEGYPMVYERLVDKTKTLKKPLNLAFVLKVMKAGWVATGQWPGS